MAIHERQENLEDRLRAIEDRLEIYNLIASHPPSADTADKHYIESIFLDDGVLDLGGSKTASGAATISGMSQRPAHQEAIRGGLAHFAGLPHIQLFGDEAVVTSYLQIVTPNNAAEEIEVPAHGVSKGHRIHRVGANRWELTRSSGGWKIKRRIYRTLDGSEAALDILRQAVNPATANSVPAD